MLMWCLLGSVHLIGMHQEPAVASEVLLAGDNAYRAHAAVRFLMYGCILEQNTINL